MVTESADINDQYLARDDIDMISRRLRSIKAGHFLHLCQNPPHTMAINLPPFDTSIPGLLLFLPVAYFLVTNFRKSGSNVPLPPGPRPLPLVGNIFGLNAAMPWVTYMEWAAVYGDLVYSRVFNLEMISINTEKMAKELLERRSYNYSDRPRFISNELTGWEFNSVLLAYGDRWRLHRRLFHQTLRADAALAYRPIQLRQIHQLLTNLLETPENCMEHLQTLASTVIVEVTYGYSTAPRHDSLVGMIQRVTDLGVQAVTPEASALLGAFPFLQYVPAWFPGAGFKRRALESQKLAKQVLELPFEYTKQSIAAGNAPPSMVRDLLSRSTEDDKSRELAIKQASASAFAAASETSSAVLKMFILAMVLHPDIRRKAQSEIDTIVGRDRLPDFSDRVSLPYIEAVYRETLRWYPIIPLGVPHAATNDDVFGDYFIPKGTIIMTNLWAMSRDEERFPDAASFKPERYFTSDGQLNDDDVGFIFGFGRRICVGRHVADATVWASIVSMLAVFNIEKAKDKQGNDIEFEPRWTTGLAVRPEPFPYRIMPRVEGEKLANMMECFK